MADFPCNDKGYNDAQNVFSYMANSYSHSSQELVDLGEVDYGDVLGRHYTFPISGFGKQCQASEFFFITHQYVYTVILMENGGISQQLQNYENVFLQNLKFSY